MPFPIAVCEVAVGEQDEAATDMLPIPFDDLFRLWLAPSFFWCFWGRVTMANEKQREFWSGKGGDNWVEHQASMDHMLGPLGERALNKLDPIAGENILDIGCGTGATTLAIADRVGTAGSVSGADISKPMLTLAQQRAKDAELANVTFQNVDIQDHAFETECFDAAFSRFGVMFFEKPVDAFTNVFTSLVSGGRLAFVCWQSPAKNPWQSLAAHTLRSLVEMPPPAPEGGPGPFAFQESDYVCDILSSAGFVAVELSNHEQTLEMYPGMALPETIEAYMSINPALRAMIADMPEGKRTNIVDALVDAFRPYHSDRGLVLESATSVVIARKSIG